MITAMLVGAVMGASLFVLLLRLAAPRTAPVVELALLDARHAVSADVEPVAFDRLAGGWDSLAGRVGEWFALRSDRLGVGYAALRQDLAITAGSLPVVLGRKLILAVAGPVLGVGLTVVASGWAGFHIPAGSMVAAAIACAAIGFFIPDLRIRREAHGRRVEFRHALGAYLDLTSLEMAGSAAPAEALPTAARVGASWPFLLIRDTLYRAARGGRSPWVALSDLGSRIGVPELRDLGGMIELVAHDGARVRSTLAARAQTMRRRELADLQGNAGKADQSMRLAQILVAFGFIIFIGYPAFAVILNS
ncbi:hypothetical protein [Nakamurella multipartita]|uniref:Type II secretion system protein n=1 Tax=Nakamurella multipartita (strain ATCC 700099 / DSM 44233 / CIP 104796 / JCM 9543 / NBRC 105858 / Y-104) TaxID=479431 RepID=C8X8Q1_NAKMY|nr:hypothetical protein [Nakamurella multipartita]ACV79106.1 hypothetical protein Namu_2760 [Nakamurella multipartita DSM 44233]